MTYRILADAVVFTHFVWIVFLIFGALLGLRNRVLRILHISGLGYAFVFQIFDWYCPLTHLEVWLRSQYAPGLAYKGSFIIYYLEEFVYPDISRSAVIGGTIFLCLFNGWIYLRKR